MNLSTLAEADAAGVAERPAHAVAGAGDDDSAWWQGLWFEGAFDPRGTAFAVSLAVGATIAMVVVATALVRIVAGV
jgi:hypothetical protein